MLYSARLLHLYIHMLLTCWSLHWDRIVLRIFAGFVMFRFDVNFWIMDTFGSAIAFVSIWIAILAQALIIDFWR